MWLIIAIGAAVLALGLAGYALRSGRQGAAQVMAATVNRDCAPWDGPAFRLSIPLDRHPEAVILVSIWKSPSLRGRTALTFSDGTDQAGSASLSGTSGQLEPLSGSVVLNGVDEAQPVEGSFDLVTETGSRFTGRFSAAWGDLQALCG
jgi:hypothetical protein